MPFAVELHLDRQADARVRDMWAALDSNGIMSLGSVPDADHHPHVSLAVFQSGTQAAVEDAVRNSLGGIFGLPLSLASLGFFPTSESVAFLGVVPTPELERHRTLLGALKPVVERLWPHYDTGVLMPHCTLATRVTDLRRVLDVIGPGSLPVVGHVTCAHWSSFREEAHACPCDGRRSCCSSARPTSWHGQHRPRRRAGSRHRYSCRGSPVRSAPVRCPASL